MNLPGWNPLAWWTGVVLRWWMAVFGADVFISYARSDGARIATKTRDALAHRLLVFLDVSQLVHGEEVPERIERELRKARQLVVILTPDALASPWVRRECESYRRFRDQRARIVPVFVRPVHPAHLPRDWQWIADRHGEFVDALAPAAPIVADEAELDVERGLRLAIEQMLRGPRQLTLARRASALIAGVLIAIPALAWFIIDRQRERTVHLQAAASAESELRFADAAWNVAMGLDVAGDDETRQRLDADLQRAFLRPFAVVDLDSCWRLEALGSHGGEPRFIVRDAERESTDGGRIGVAGPAGWFHLLDAPSEAQPQCAIAADVAFVLASGILHRIPFDGTAERSVPAAVTRSLIVGALDCTQLSVRDGEVLLLDRALPQHHLLVFDAHTLDLKARFTIEDEENSETLVALSRRSGALAIVVRRRVGTAELGLSVSRLTRSGELMELRDFAPDLQRKHVGSVFSLYSIELAPDDGQVFVALHELNLWGAPESRGGGVHWLALDPESARAPLTLEPGIDALRPTLSLSAFEAVYQRDSHELRALSCRSLVLLDRPAVTVAPRADAWTLLEMPPPGLAFRAFVATRTDLVVYDDARPVLRTAWRHALGSMGVEPEPLKMLASADDRFVVLELAAGEAPTRTLIVWRCDPVLFAQIDSKPDRVRRALLEWDRLRLPAAPDSR